jgi:hypothetical protein
MDAVLLVNCSRHRQFTRPESALFCILCTVALWWLGACHEDDIYSALGPRAMHTAMAHWEALKKEKKKEELGWCCNF